MRTVLRTAFLIGFFQALMPLLGWLLTFHFSKYIQDFDHWVAFGMLAFIGGKMIVESFKEEQQRDLQPARLKTQLALAVATSIDALAVGITYACTGYATAASLLPPLAVIGTVSFLMSLAGFRSGAHFGDIVNKKIRPELLGGLILLGIGVRILIEHLG